MKFHISLHTKSKISEAYRVVLQILNQTEICLASTSNALQCIHIREITQNDHFVVNITRWVLYFPNVGELVTRHDTGLSLNIHPGSDKQTGFVHIYGHGNRLVRHKVCNLTNRSRQDLYTYTAMATDWFVTKYIAWQ